MYKVIIKNKYGQEIDLMSQKDYKCVDIENIGGAEADLSETENANIDGSIINSERINSRTIKISVRIFSNCGISRAEIYQVALIKQYIKLSLVNDIRSVFIEGTVKSIDVPLFTDKQFLYINILCPEPYFKEMAEIENEFSLYEGMFHFPFAIKEEGIPFTIEHNVVLAEVVNSGEVSTGAVFVLRASGNVENPQLFNTTTNEYIKLNTTMILGDEIIINTNARNKSVQLKRNNIYTNIIGTFDLTSTWLQMSVGSNKMSYTCDTGSDKLEIYVRFTNKFLGV